MLEACFGVLSSIALFLKEWSEVISALATTFASFVALYLGLTKTRPKGRLEFKYGYRYLENGSSIFIQSPRYDAIENLERAICISVVNCGIPDIRIVAVGVHVSMDLKKRQYYIPPECFTPDYRAQIAKTCESISITTKYVLFTKHPEINQLCRNLMFARNRLKIQVDLPTGQFIRAKFPRELFKLCEDEPV